MSATDMLTAALAYSQQGWRVLPVWWALPDGRCACALHHPDRSCTAARPSVGKHPIGSLVPRGLVEATSDPSTIRRWWGRYPEASIGVALAASGMFALDVDLYHGDDEKLTTLVTEHGPLPETVLQVSGSGKGYHVLFRAPPHPVRGQIGGVTTRARNFVVLAPSTHASGGRYAWAPGCAPGEVPLAALPPAWSRALEPDASVGGDAGVPPEADEPAWLRAVSANARAIAAREHVARQQPEVRGVTAAGKLYHVCRDVARGFALRDPRVAGAIVESYAARCDPPYPRAEWARRLTSAYREAHSPPWGEAVKPEQVALAEMLGAEYAATAPTSAPVAAPSSPTVAEAPHTDGGNAEVFAREHGGGLVWVSAWGTWLRYVNTRWQRMPTETLIPLAISTARRFYERASDSSLPAEVAHALAKHARGTEAAGRLEAMIRLARGMLAKPASAFDADPFTINVNNGTLDLRSGELRPHSRDDLLTRLAPVDYDPEARAPTWDAFVARVLPDPGAREFVRRYVGYCLTGDVGAQVLAFFYGLGANGKTTMLEALMHVLGDYAKPAAPDLLLAKNGEAHPTEQAALQGARLVVAQEVEAGRAWAERTVKQLTGGDPITARFMHCDFFSFVPTHKLIVAANHRPKVRGQDEAIWRRIRLVPFNVTIPKAERDPDLPAKLRAEAAGVFAWAVAGCLAWRQDGLGESEAVTAATAGYREDQDHLGHWIADACEVTPDAFTSTSDLYHSYTAWCAATGCQPWRRETFREGLCERGLVEHRTKTARGIKGVRMRGLS